MTDKQSKNNIKVAAGIVAVGVLMAGSTGVAAADLQPRTIQVENAELAFPGVDKAVSSFDVVAIAHFTGVSDRKYAEYTQPGEEGYVLGDPGDVYSLLNFQIIKTLKGEVNVGKTIQVAVHTGLLNDRTFLPGKRLDRVATEGFSHFFDGTVRREAASPTKYTRLIMLNTQENNAFSAPSWGLAPITKNTAHIGARFHGDSSPESPSRITAIPVKRFLDAAATASDK